MVTDGSGDLPKLGDLSVCAYCGTALTFTSVEPSTLERLSPEAFAELTADEQRTLVATQTMVLVTRMRAADRADQ